MEARRYPISNDILRTYVGAGVILIAISVISFLATFSLAWMATNVAEYSPDSPSTAPKVVYRGSASRRDAAGGLSFVVFVLGVGLCAGFGAVVPFRRANEAQGSFVELDAEQLRWVKGYNSEVCMSWSDVRDVYSTSTSLLVSGKSEKLEIPAEYENFEDLIERVKARGPG